MEEVAEPKEPEPVSYFQLLKKVKTQWLIIFSTIKPVKSEAQEEMERNGATVEIGFPLKSEI